MIAALKETGLAAERLELEITEALLLERDDNVLSTLNGLRNLGVGISMDDFGTGYSSAVVSARLPVHEDQDRPELRARPAQQRRQQGDYSRNLSLGQNLGMSVIAEGIENEEDLAFLIGEGCREGQGYCSPSRAPPKNFSPMWKKPKRRSRISSPACAGRQRHPPSGLSVAPERALGHVR